MPKHNDKKPKNMKPMSKEDHNLFKRAVKEGLITKTQHDKLPPNLLKGIIKKKENDMKKNK